MLTGSAGSASSVMVLHDVQHTDIAAANMAAAVAVLYFSLFISLDVNA